MKNVTSGAESDGINLTCGLSGNHDFIFTMVPIVYGCNFIIGIVGNSMVVAVIYCYMKLKTVAHIFVLNLAISDLTFLITLPMWATMTATGYQWPFGAFLCKAAAALASFNLYTSIFFLTALSIDRYLAIVHPVSSRRFRTVLYARITCVLIWLFALLLSVPIALTRDIHNINNGNLTVCAILHTTKDNVQSLEQVLLANSLMKTLLGFLIPFIIIITCYCLIGRALLGARHIQKSSQSRDDEVLRMLAAAVLAFFVCWVPHQIFHFMQLLTQLKKTDCRILEIIDTAMPFTICIAYFNSCVNPIVYGFVGRNFRKNLVRLLHCAPASVRGAHPSISSKMSALSFRASEALSLTVKNKSSSDIK
ncbi:hypothetical protein NQD34_015018 [Periophthalmus magnuspinnatus]|uniref:Type-1 angiotensin II receptor n=1 Tax=Periophthalmus magnuspinnatus TaxID=409849 RepID=A0A3B3ZGW4_9GOBI|nr:type-1 angiotensin II receptor [Periophthalmus magnuspinnatus]XP_055086182.1 type-1 angiotensin II receptor [Periophthalmus magnuspinnatus]XP_055086183.1 type-1 angiotensin II receptor [Periophthalmus magnuspinnatus]KAJ0022884.1 hypothetical protein NQD34_015018 [Periophthalmus magnuspinnatus]